MPQAVIGAVAAPIVGAIAGKALGPRSPQGQTGTPQDLMGLRGQNINFLQSLLGGPGGPMAGIDRQFGGVLNSPLQRMATNTIQQYATAQRPEMRTLEALLPTFDRNLAAANQSGGRFGSANALMRSRALEDFNILGANISQQAQQQQIQAANMLAMFGQQDIANRLGLFNELFGIGAGASFNNPTMMQPSGMQQGANMGGMIGQGLMSAMPWIYPNNPAAQNPAVSRGNQTQSMGK